MKATRADKQLAKKYATAVFGHNICCVFCGWKLSHHDGEAGEVEQPQQRKRGYRFSFDDCPGWAPKDQEGWRREEATVTPEERRRAEEKQEKVND